MNNIIRQFFNPLRKRSNLTVIVFSGLLLAGLFLSHAGFVSTTNLGAISVAHADGQGDHFHNNGNGYQGNGNGYNNGANDATSTPTSTTPVVTPSSTTPTSSTPCTLSASDLETALQNGSFVADPVVMGSGTASVTFTNNTGCVAPVGLSSYQMFVAPNGPQWLSTQQIIDATSSSIAAGATQTLTVNLASCMTQVDAWYGAIPTALLDSNPYAYPNVPFTYDYAISNGALCVAPGTSTPTSTTPVVTPTSTMPTPCTLSAADFTNDLASGTISFTPIAITSSTATITVTNNSNCGANLDFGSNEMFVPVGGPNWLGSQVPFSRATSTLAASSTVTMTVSLPNCMAQIDAWQDVNSPNPFSYAFTALPLCTNGGGGGVTTPATSTLTVNVSGLNAGDTASLAVNDITKGTTQSTSTGNGSSAFSLTTNDNYAVSATTTNANYSVATSTGCAGTLSSNATCNVTFTLNNGGGNGGGTTPSSTDADIAVTKTVDNANPVAGATVNYTITVTANGPATSTIVSAQDILPMGLSLVNATASVGMYDMTGDWYIGTLSPNATATLQIAAQVANNEAGQTITNTATVSELSSLVDQNLANNSSSVSISVQPAACTSNCGGGGTTTGGGGGSGSIPTAEIGITKTVDNANPNAGDTINYTLTVAATGPATSPSVVATDLLPSGVTFVSASTSVGTYDSTTGTWTLGNVAAGTSPTLVITATVNASDPNGEVITNTAMVAESNTANDPLTGNNSSSVSITVGGSNGGGGGTVSGGGTSGGGSVGVSGGGVPVGNIGGGNGGSTAGGGEVLGASASCGLYLDQYIHPIRKDLNDPAEVEKLQEFLNMNLGTNLPITGYYGDQTIAAVNQFQVKYHIEVLQPWVAYGLPNQYTPTSYVYKTTQRWINLIMCSSLNLPIPQLP